MTDQIERVARAINSAPVCTWVWNRATKMYDVYENSEPEPRLIAEFSNEHEAFKYAVKQNADNRARAAIAAASEWLPIESAPKDGTRILLVSHIDPDEAHVCQWDNELAQSGWGPCSNDGWMICATGRHFYGHVYRSATHWQPLPQPSKVTA